MNRTGARVRRWVSVFGMPTHIPSSASRVRRAAAVTSSVVLVAALASGCSDVADRVLGRTPTPTTEPVGVPQGQEALARFYEQQLDWVTCGPGDCAELEVPLDYAEPDGETIEVSLLRVPARDSRGRIGSLVVNPGGPGGSGVDYAAAADFIVGSEVRQRYDIVGFDPRGVARSAPVDCASDEEMDLQLGFIEAPDGLTDAELAAEFAQGCETNAGAIAGHVSTVHAAKDMDILRSALGEEKLTFLGKSYGTYLGAVFAEQFPDRVGRFVLDGALPPDLTSEDITVGQAAGFERASRAWAADCIDSGECAFGDDVDSVMAGLAEFLDGVEESSIPVQGDARVSELGEGGAFYGVIAAMYDQGMWSFLTEALADAVVRNDGTALQGLANSYAERSPSGTYAGNLLEANSAINCLDRRLDGPPTDLRQRASEAAPVWGPIFTEEEGDLCEEWPFDLVGGGPRTIAAEGSAPIVVVGTTRDPATPYEWSEQLAEQLASGVLVSLDGDGHTAYMRSNGCIDDAIDAFYLEGTVPEDGLTC